MPNTFAYVVLFSWPLVVLILFRRLPVPSALVWSVLGGYLFLPRETGIDLPILPPLDKETIPALSAAVMCLNLRRAPRRQRGAEVSLPASRALRRPVLVCLGVLAVTPVLTFMNNSEPVRAPGLFIPGIRPYDVGSILLTTLMNLVPFLLARRFLASREAQVTLIKAFVAAGLIYLLFIFVEVRLSPQLNRWLYGFHAHSFAQHIRFDGFRPMVFLKHGLRVGIFMAVAVLAAATLWRIERAEWLSGNRKRGKRPPGRWLLATCLLLVGLFVSKTVGAFLITIILLPVVLLAGRRVQVIVAAVIAVAVLVFPMLRGAGLVPTDTLVTWAASLDSDRAQSLQFRFDNEDILLARANEKPLTGWGSWGRNRVFDPETGRDLSVTDGTWVIFMGTSGWLGYLAWFGLLTLPILALVRRRDLDPVMAGLAVMLAANLVDLPW